MLSQRIHSSYVNNKLIRFFFNLISNRTNWSFIALFNSFDGKEVSLLRRSNISYEMRSLDSHLTIRIRESFRRISLFKSYFLHYDWISHTSPIYFQIWHKNWKILTLVKITPYFVHVFLLPTFVGNPMRFIAIQLTPILFSIPSYRHIFWIGYNWIISSCIAVQRQEMELKPIWQAPEILVVNWYFAIPAVLNNIHLKCCINHSSQHSFSLQ